MPTKCEFKPKKEYQEAALTRPEAERRVIEAARNMFVTGRQLYGEHAYRLIELQDALAVLDALPDTGEADGREASKPAPDITLIEPTHMSIEDQYNIQEARLSRGQS